MIKTYDDYELYTKYSTIDNPKGVIIFSHGFVEYSAHYSKLPMMFAKCGYNVMMYDVRGHGRTTAPLGDLKAFEDYADDLNRIVAWLQDQDSTLPIFTMGFSLGGMITALYGVMYPYGIQGQILMGPGIIPQPQFENLTEESISIHKFLELMNTKGDGGIRQLVAMDSPYVLSKATRTFLEESLVKAQRFIWDNLTMYQHPILVLQGAKDPIIKASGTKSFYEALNVADKTYKEYPDFEHDMLRIKDAQSVVNDIASWCDDHI